MNFIRSLRNLQGCMNGWKECNPSMKNDFFTKNRVKTALRVGLAIYLDVAHHEN